VLHSHREWTARSSTTFGTSSQFLNGLDDGVRAEVERDLDLIGQRPENPDLPWWPYQETEDDIPIGWPSRVASIAGGRFLIRYIAWATPPYYAAVEIIEPDNPAPASDRRGL